MILDKKLIMSKAQAETTVGTHVSNNVIDTLKLGDAVNELYFEARGGTKCTSGGAATVQVKFITDPNEALNAGPTVLWESGAIAVASLVDGYLFGSLRLPKPDKLERYLAAQIVIGTATLTAGTFNIYLTDNPQTNFQG